MSVVTRFAPSPTGRLHLGHAYAALFAEDAARRAGGRFLLRIEDIDATRCRPEHEAGILEDLGWLGLVWETPVRRQSAHLADYRDAVAKLDGLGLLYPCFCTRREIADEIARAGAAPHGAEGPVYPGICRHRTRSDMTARLAGGAAYALRLDVAKALAATGPLEWEDEGAGKFVADPAVFGDVVIARKETPTSYHLAVTVDDAAQGVTLVTRGRDLLPATAVHRLLQALLGLPTPRWHHHDLVPDENGERLAKRAGAPTITQLRARGTTPREIRRRLGFG